MKKTGSKPGNNLVNRYGCDNRTTKRIVVSLLAIISALAFSAQAASAGTGDKAKAAKKLSLVAYRTDTPPKLDGDMTDVCWKTAPIAKRFRLLGVKTPAKYQTQVRVCYDTENLYIFMRAESPAFTKKDLDTTTGKRKFQHYSEALLGWDNMGFLLAQPHKFVDCFYFATNPLARRSDNRRPSKKTWDRFNPLKVQTSRDANGWNAEMSVPFCELGSWHANLGATPVVGAEWKILFFREHGRFKESSTWPPAGAEYRKHRKLGQIVFKGHRRGVQIPSVTINVPQVTDVFVEIKANANQPLRCEYVQVRKDHLLDKGEKTFRGSLRLPWIVDRIPEYFRNYQMDIRVYQGSKLIFVGNSIRSVSPGYYHYSYVKQFIDVNLRRLKGVPGKRATDLRKKLITHKKRSEFLKAQLDSCKRVGDKQWNDAAREILSKIRQKSLEWNQEQRHMPYILYTLNKVRKDLAGKKIPQLEERIKAMKSQLGALSKRSKTCPAEAKDLQELAVDTAKLALANEELDFDIWRAILARKEKGAAFAAFPVGVYAKTFPKKKLDPSQITKVELAAAGNERESFQVYVAPLRGEVKGVNVSFSPLTKPGSKQVIPAANFSWRIVNYMLMLGAKEGEDPLKAEDPTTTFPRPLYPDPLYPGKTFTLPADMQKTIWVDFHCPPKTPPGEYKGTMTIAAGPSKVDIPVKVKVYGFDLPRKPTLRINHWFAPVYGKRIYGDKAPKKYTPKMFEQDCAFLSQYRLPHFLDERATVMETIRLYLEKDGRLTVDFTELDKFYDIARKYGANWVRGSFSCNQGALSGWHNGHLALTDRETGKDVMLYDAIPEYYKKRKEEKVDVLDNPMWQQFFRQCADFLERRGLLKNNTYYEMFDEQSVDVVVKGHKKLRQICPKMPLGNFGPYPLKVNREGETSVGYTDIWGPALKRHDNPKVCRAIHDRVSNHGEKSMAYLSSSHSNMPHLAVHRSFLGPRLAHWQVWRHKVDAFLMFKLNATPHTLLRNKKRMAKPLETRFDGPWEIKKGFADWGSNILYAGPNRTMIPGMRLVALRDGMEDYEYFHLLKTRADAFKPKTKEDRRLLKSARSALEVPQDICGSIGKWTTDESKINAHREKLAELITKLPPVSLKLKKLSISN